MAGTQINAVSSVQWPMSISNEFLTTTNLDAYTGNDNWTTTVQGGSFIYLEDNASFSGARNLRISRSRSNIRTHRLLSLRQSRARRDSC